MREGQFVTVFGVELKAQTFTNGAKQRLQFTYSSEAVFDRKHPTVGDDSVSLIGKSK